MRKEIRPLGALLHIAAGNAEGLPFFSVVEGLLAGNVNILKLPGTDDAVSTALLLKLIEMDPVLAEYIYVFDTPSDDIASMRMMADAADGIAVWGSDRTVRAVRQLADENMKIIEWGHKESFAYVTKRCFSDEAQLTLLAHNICSTEQLLCSSCQGIFLDTDDLEDVYGFCETFINILQEISGGYPQTDDIGRKAGITLRLRNLEIESALGKARVYKGKGCSLAALPAGGVEPSIAFRNCWVKRLPKESIPDVLKAEKNHLQTMALICADEERGALAERMFRSGFVRVTTPGKMSKLFAGAPHDGEYPLRRYTKIVCSE